MQKNISVDSVMRNKLSLNMIFIDFMKQRNYKSPQVNHENWCIFVSSETMYIVNNRFP